MLTILAPILVFGLVIFVHELGHFIAAKLVGVYAPRFSIGFGPTLWKHRWGETEYVLGALPLGGYVRMASRLDEDMALIEGGSEEKTRRREDDPDYDPSALMPFGPRPIPAERMFENKPLPGRLLIMIAGVTMNVLLAVVVLTAVVWNAGRPFLRTRVVGAVQPPAGAPALAQLQPGDTVARVNGQPVDSWNAVERAISESRDAVVITTQRGDVRVPLSSDVTADSIVVALQPHIPAVLDSVVAGDPASRAGVAPGDTVVSVDGAPILGWYDVVTRVSASPGRPVALEIGRAGGRRMLTVVPRVAEEPDPRTGATRKVGKIGVAVRDNSERRPIGPGAAMKAGVRGTIGYGREVVNIVRRLLTGSVSVRQLGGPIAITKASVQAARSGLDALFMLIAFLSVNVAILNLLPIPILDGGQIVLNIVESVKGSPLSLRTREYLLRAGLFAIALLFLVVMYNDTRDSLARVFDWVARLFG